MENTKAFPIEVVLTLVTGKLLCSMSQVYEALDWLLDENLFTHQLPRAKRFVEPVILNAHPYLRFIKTSHINPDNAQEEIEIIKRMYPDNIHLNKIPGYQSMNPVQELDHILSKPDH